MWRHAQPYTPRQFRPQMLAYMVAHDVMRMTQMTQMLAIQIRTWSFVRWYSTPDSYASWALLLGLWASGLKWPQEILIQRLIGNCEWYYTSLHVLLRTMVGSWWEPAGKARQLANYFTLRDVCELGNVYYISQERCCQSESTTRYSWDVAEPSWSVYWEWRYGSRGRAIKQVMN